MMMGIDFYSTYDKRGELAREMLSQGAIFNPFKGDHKGDIPEFHGMVSRRGIGVSRGEFSKFSKEVFPSPRV